MFRLLPVRRLALFTKPSRRLFTTAVSQPLQFSNEMLALQLKSWWAKEVASPARTHMCGTLREINVGSSVSICGWIQSSRLIGSLWFAAIRDHTGIMQCVWTMSDADRDEKASLFREVSKLGLESVVRICGQVTQRPDNMQNAESSTGAIELQVKDVLIFNSVNKCPIDMVGPPPSEAHALRYRYLDLRREMVQRVIRFRSTITWTLRQCFHEHGFIEVETPLLFKSTPEGAAEFLVPSRLPGHCYALPQSPQQHKQMLMTGGVDKYFQIARCFRDEAQRADRQPEFTQIDVEMSFVRREDLMQMGETLVKRVLAAANVDLQHSGLSFPLPVLSYREAMNRFGSDKPDTRFAMEIHDVTEVLQPLASQLPVFVSTLQSRTGHIKCLNLKGAQDSWSKQELTSIRNAAQAQGSQSGIVIIRVSTSSEWAVPKGALGLSGAEIQRQLSRQLHIEPGDLLCFSWGSWEHTCLVLGAVRSLGSQLLVSRGVLRLVPRKFNFLWVVDFPLLERRDDGVGRWKAVHHPFTAPHPDDLPALLTALDSGEQDEPLLALRAQAYDLVCNGVEVGGGSIRVHQEWLQQKLFRFLDIDPSLFEHLLGALRWGCPPHGGFALGLDRLVAILASETAYPLKIKDVIAFPKSGNGADLTVGAPAKVTDASLASFGLQLTQLEPLSSSSTSSLTSSNL